MKKISTVSLTIVLIFVALFMRGKVSNVEASENKVFEFKTMVGVSSPYTGATNAIRGVRGGGVPWVVESAEGKLRPDGSLKINVTGLVIDPNINNANAGKNPIPNFKAIVSCLSKDAAGNPTTENVSTDLFPADLQGNSSIDAVVDLPEPCIAPIIFITSPSSATNPTGSWFAATGQ